MSGYHFHVEFVSRGAGQSVVAKGAYHARAEFQEQRTGETKDYTYKNDRPVWSGVFADKAAPATFQQNESLLNEIDRRERRKDSQTALNFTGALPDQLTDEQRQYMVRDFAREQFLRKHLAAVAHIHRPSEKGDDRNQHVHILVGTRTVGPDGFGEKFITRENYGQQLEQWREKWAELGGRYLEKAGYKLEADRWRVGHLDLERQGQAALERGDLAEAERLKDKQATKHRGPAADAMERKGQQTERGNIHRDTIEHNSASAELRGLRLEFADIQKQIEREERAWQEASRSAAREAGNTGAGQQPLHGTAAEIREAAQRSDNPKALAAALGEKGIELAMVTKAEAERSRTDAAAARENGQYAPVYRQHEIVAVDSRAFVYRFSEKTTGTDFRDMQRYLRTLDTSKFKGIDDTRRMMVDRAAALVMRGGRKALQIVASVAHRAADIAGDLLAGAPVPKTRQQVEILIEDNQRNRRAAEKEAAAVHRWQDYTDEHEQITAKLEQQAREAKTRDDQYQRLQQDRDRGGGRERDR